MEVEISFPHLPASETSARFCLDRILSLVIKKQSHFQSARYLSRGKSFRVKLPEIKNLYEKASLKSKVIRVLEQDSTWDVTRIVGGLETNNQFIEINHFNFIASDSDAFLTSGYVLIDFELKFEQVEDG